MKEKQKNLYRETKQRKNNNTVLFYLAIIAVVSGVISYFCDYSIVDEIRRMQFTPTERIERVASKLELTSVSKRVFYATHPEIQDRTKFNNSCKSIERTAAILGCYYNSNIYLFDVQNDKLDGALEVTASHELLHAIYERLNIFERSRVDEMVRNEYEKIKDNEDIQQLMAYYSKIEPSNEINELHSIIGTTIDNLSPELESHYARYFNNRSKIVSMNDEYNKVFDELRSRAEILDKELKEEMTKINDNRSLYEEQLAQLNRDIEVFNARVQSGELMSRNEYDISRNDLLQRIYDIKIKRDILQKEIDDYNNKVNEFNDIAIETQKLNESINGITKVPDGV